METHPLAEQVDAGWARALAPVVNDISRMGQFLRAEMASGHRYLPPGPLVLRAFTQPFDEVKVLVVGQDPYPTPGHAVGLSFCVDATTQPLPRSLVNIFTEYCSDLNASPPTSGDLSPWAASGVLLLNRVLTVRPGSPASHRGKGWEKVTEHAVRALVERNQPLVAVLWGRDAQSLGPLLAGVPAVRSVHPSPLSAANGFFGSRPFSRTNEMLLSQGATPVDWRLP